MRVLIDASSLLLRSAGIKNYTYHWIRHLRLLAGEEAVRAFPLIGRFGPLDHERSVVSRAGTVPRLGLLYLTNVTPLPVLDLLTRGIDVFHCSNQVRRVPRGKRLTATVHDMTCWLREDVHTAANVRADRNFAEVVLKRADGLVAVSENTKRDTVRLLGVAPEKVEVIYPGIAEPFFHTTEAGAQEVRSRYGLQRPYVLYVGTVEPRKNLDGLIEAYRRLKPDVRDAFDLVVVGPVGWAAGATISRLKSSDGGIRYLGYVPEDDLPHLTRGATVFAYPSLYEGFGFPIAQAMAAGVPVVTSNLSSMPEVAGEAAVYADPKSCQEITGALESLLTSPALRERLSRCGAERAQQFRWELCARRSLEFFERICG